LIRERHTHHLKIRSIQDHSCCIFLFHFSSTISPEPKHFVLLIPMNDPNLEQNVLSFFLLILRAPLIRHFDSFSETLVSFFSLDSSSESQFSFNIYLGPSSEPNPLQKICQSLPANSRRYNDANRKPLLEIFEPSSGF
jgi:hypothetical protein